MAKTSIKNSELANFLFENERNFDKLVEYMVKRFNVAVGDSESLSRQMTTCFLVKFNKKYQKAARNKSRFMTQNSFWLNECYFNYSEPSANVAVRKKVESRIVPSISGRPKKSFEDCSDRTKRRRSMKLNSLYSRAELSRALEYNLVSSGQKDIAAKIKKLLSVDEDEEEADVSTSESFSGEEALTLLIDAKLSKFQYNRIRSKSIEKGSFVFPPYKTVLAAKKACYPSPIVVSEEGVKIGLQPLLDSTVSRLLISLHLTKDLDDKDNDLIFYSKWGCDGSSGHSRYKQNFENPDHTDESVFMTSLVPLRLASSPGNASNLIWANRNPASTNLCRPLRFEFCKETSEKILKEVDSVKNEIAGLCPTIVEVGNRMISVKHELQLTMIDGKVCQALTGTPSAASCPVCGAKPTEMNQLDSVRKRPIIEESIEYGLSTLHAWIRFMECILHIAYRIGFNKWSVRSAEDKTMMDTTKKRIQLQLKEKLGIIVDMPRQGYGTSNDGNTARKFFRNWETAADVTGLSKDLIYRFYIILQVLASSEIIDSSKFDSYCAETANMYVNLYGWYFMPSSVHRILIHGKNVLDSISIPIGHLSEEAQESRNKDFKRFRQFNTRKNSRSLTNEDLVHNLLISSNPLINNFRSQWTKSSIELEEDAKELVYTENEFEDTMDHSDILLNEECPMDED